MSLIARFIVLIWFGAIAAIHLAKADAMVNWQLNTDFYKFWQSAQSLHDNRSVYTELAAPGHFGEYCAYKSPWIDTEGLEQTGKHIKVNRGYNQCLHPNLNPPFFVALVYPLGFLEYNDAWWLWSGFSILSCVLAAFLLALLLADRFRLPVYFLTALISASLLTWTPAIVNTQLGQLGMFILLPLAAAFYLFEYGKPIWAGVLIGVCVGIKLFLALFLVTLLLSRFYDVLIGALAGFGLTIVIGWFFLGVDGYLDYLYIAQFVGWTNYSWNSSLPGMVDRLWVAFLGDYVEKPHALVLLEVLFNLILLVFSYIIAKKFIFPLSDRTSRFAIIFSLTLMLSILLSPLGWNYYFPFLVFPCVLMIVKMQKSSGRSIYLMGIVFFLLVTAMPIPLFELNHIDATPMQLVYASTNFAALILLYFLFLACIARDIGNSRKLAIENNRQS